MIFRNQIKLSDRNKLSEFKSFEPFMVYFALEHWEFSKNENVAFGLIVLYAIKIGFEADEMGWKS